MSYEQLTAQEKEIIKQAIIEHGNITRAVKALNCKYNKHIVRNVVEKDLGLKVRKGCKKLILDNLDNNCCDVYEFDESNNKACLTVRSTIRDLDGVLQAANIDLDIWEVERYVVNKWDNACKLKSADGEYIQATELWQVKVWLRRRNDLQKYNAILSLINKINEYAIEYDVKPRNNGEYLLEISLFDVHFGKLAWSREVGEDYDLKVAEYLYSSAIEGLLSMAKTFVINNILLPIGQDFFHVNDPSYLTPKGGNKLDADNRLAKIFETGYISVIRAIDRCIQVAPVEVIWVPGNHDPETSLYLCHVIKAWYNKCDAVTVDVEPKTRKYKEYGVNLIGFTHGDEEPQHNLPSIMASEAPQAWANTLFREWHIGHKHKKAESRYLAGDTFDGVVVRTIPSLSGLDAWHYRRGYINPRRAAEAYLWHRDTGYAGHFSANVINGKVCCG